MGLLAKDYHDVFFSYATIDNRLHDNWIKDFRDDLKTRVLVEMNANVSGFKDLDLDQIDFFIDYQGIPANGGLVDAIVAAIKKSNFLFMFVGDGYLRSDYCSKELEWFSSRFSGIESEALKHTFMFMLTRSAVRGASAGTLGEIKTKAKYESVFDNESGLPIARMLPTSEGDRAVVNPIYTKLVNKIATTMCQRILEAGVGSPRWIVENRDRRHAPMLRARVAEDARAPAVHELPAAHAKIFISYRREDSAGNAGRVFDRLSNEFGRDLLFMDVDAIPLGVDFVKFLQTEVAKCSVLLAIIGRDWLNQRDEDGQRRLDKDDDFVRVEIAAALRREIRVIPIMLDGAKVPSANQLPADLQELSRRNGLNVRHSSFHADMDILIRGLKARLEADS